MSDAGSEPELDLSNVSEREGGRGDQTKRGAVVSPRPPGPHPATHPQSDVVTKYKAAAEIANGEGTGKGGSGRCETQPGTRPSVCSPPSPSLPPPPPTPSAALKAVIEECKPGAKIADICVKGDAVVEE